jgi:hypothetical protein
MCRHSALASWLHTTATTVSPLTNVLSWTAIDLCLSKLQYHQAAAVCADSCMHWWHY